MSKKLIHKPKDREQLIAELKKNQDWAAKMKFTKEQFYPALLELDSSVDDIKMFLSSIDSILMERFLGKMKETKFSDMKLIDVLDKKESRYEGYVKIMELFNDMNTYDARDAIAGMKGELDTFVNDEMKNRKLSSLKTKWLDELKNE